MIPPPPEAGHLPRQRSGEDWGWGGVAEMQSATRLTLLLCAAWAATVLYGEMGAYWASYLACSWPSPSLSSSPPVST